MTPNLNSPRAKEARLGKTIGKTGGWIIATCAVVSAIIGLVLVVFGEYSSIGWLVLSLASLSTTFSLWYFLRLAVLPTKMTSTNFEDRLTGDALSSLPAKQELTPQMVWRAFNKNWHRIFFTNHLLLTPDTIEQLLSNQPQDMLPVWEKANTAATEHGSPGIETGFIIAGILSTSPGVTNLLKQMKMQPSDIDELTSWLARGLESINRTKQSFGGIGRDWAFGYTPILNQFGNNISMSIANHGAHFGWLTESNSVKAIETALNNRTSALAVVGENGSGKSSHVYAFAQKLIEGKTAKSLAYHQIIGLDASRIISSAEGPGALEKIMLAIVNEAAHASHIILFLDNAELFLSSGPGSFDASHILQPLLQNHTIPMILSLTPADFQRLKSSNPSFAGLLTPIILQEPDEGSVMRVLEDTAIGLESKHKVMVSLGAIKESYSLSGRYDQDKVYPGRAIDLLEQAISYPVNGSVITELSVQQAIEQTHGVKVSGATQAEASELLNLEDKIHERMINQARAVSVVSAALRRSRAGVASTNRPIGSFLFLGPTGVGKTELAKSIAATYFGNEANMVRLDMSEYQQPDDVQRLLANGENETGSLILSIRQQPFTVVLLDEIEKAHPNILNLLLQLLDEGQLTDNSGKKSSFKDAIIIATSNAGADTIRAKIEQGQELKDFETEFTNQLISSGQFKPELLNRFDEIVLFRPLKPEELNQVVRLMLTEVNKTLANQNITVSLTEEAINTIVEQGNDPRLGARPMRRAIQRMVEDNIANKILRGEANPGDNITLDLQDITNQPDQS